VSAVALRRLSRPRVALASLYHPENFPLPRFPLGISDIARAIRREYTGAVILRDMQLGWTLEQLLAWLDESNADIIGISSTFGQHDLLEQALVHLLDRGRPCQVVVGGSLAALNADALAARYPSLLIGTGPGERTMVDLVRRWHDDSVPGGVRYLRPSKPLARGLMRLGRRRPLHRDGDDFLPELDLLGRILDAGGVFQAESSRGCTHACSFCPREHKGQWQGHFPGDFDAVLAHVEGVFSARPQVAKKVFLVDEEFVGRAGQSRALAVAQTLHSRGFTWETSSRVDQVCRPDRSDDWHQGRAEFWAELRAHGLDRCLFGVESGVDNILKRFNKRTTGDQNALAIRTLTALGIPIRCTYITFDPLMTIEELAATHAFLGRNDLILRDASGHSPAELPNLVRNDDWARQHAAGFPFYTHVSYMLVSMECLVGSPYLRAVEQAGLAGPVRLSMGRRDARYRDPKIGVMSDWGQRWVDRNFSLDYTLKSLEKLAVGDERAAIRRLRYPVRSYAHLLLGDFLSSYKHLSNPEVLEGCCQQRLSELADVLFAVFENGRNLDPQRAAVLARELERWAERKEWTLING